MCTGTCPVSSGGTCSTAVTSSGAAARRTPHSGQKWAPSGIGAAQFGQLAADMHLCFCVAGTPIERPQSFGGPPPEGPDELAVVLVRDLARSVVELELFQGRESTVALFGELEAPALAGVGLSQPVFRRREPRMPQERQRDDDDAGDREKDADPEPNAHTANARRGLEPASSRPRVLRQCAAPAPGNRAPRRGCRASPP